MAGEWQEIAIGDAFEVNPYRAIKRGQLTPFIPMGALPEHARSASRIEVREFTGSGTKFQNGDTLIARITPCLENGKTAFVAGLSDGVVAHGSTEYIVLSGKHNQSDNLFAYYLAQSPSFRRYAIGHMEGTSGRQRVPSIAVERYVVALPPFAEQRAIAHILGTLDDKIENNRKTAQTLEAMTQAIFKSWFVDFEPVRAKMEGRDTGLPKVISDLFPDRFVESELGEIPEGWKVGCLGDVADHPRRGIQPDDIEDGTPYIALEHMPKGRIALTEWGTADALESNKYVFKRGEILFGKLRPYFHKVGVAPVDGVCSTDIVVLTAASSNWFGFVLGHVSSSEFVEYTNAGSTGTKMPRTSWSDMARYELVLPPKPVAKAFTELMQPSVDRITAGIHQSRTLAALRDTLLPKLISGELRVKDAEHSAESTV